MRRRPENILFIWDQLGRVGGVEVFLYQSLKWLPDHGLIPYVLEVGQGGGSQSEQFRPFDDRIIRAPDLGTLSSNIKPSEVLAKIAKLGIRVIILNSWEYNEILDLPRKDLTIPVISIVHNDRDVFYEMARLLQDRVSTIVGVSERIRTKLKAVVPLSRRSIVRYIPYGVESVALREPKTFDRPLQLVYLGRIQQEQKRIFDLVPFVTALNALGVNCVLNVIGDGGDVRELFDKLSLRPGTAQINFWGPVLHREAMQQLSTQDIYLLFSEFEGLPISLLEALTRGVVPVVSQISSGVSEILIDSVNARIFPIGRADLAAKIVAELAQDRLQLFRLSQSAKQLGDKFSIDKMFASYADMLWETIETTQQQRFPWPLRKLRQLAKLLHESFMPAGDK
jgi:glycosyltransferase involved in cell wall biosynthesis